MTKECEMCGKTFTKKPNQKPSKFRLQRFCCRKCSALYASSFTKGNKAHNRNRIERVCLHCGKVTRVPVSLSDRPFCNRECMSKWMSDNIRGDKHWNWQGGITEKQSRDNLYDGYKEWRKAVYKRDGYKCRVCGNKKSGELRAHHIDCVKDNPDLVTNVYNGITLCEDCHKIVHYGKYKNLYDKFIRQGNTFRAVA